MNAMARESVLADPEIESKEEWRGKPVKSGSLINGGRNYG